MLFEQRVHAHDRDPQRGQQHEQHHASERRQALVAIGATGCEAGEQRAAPGAIRGEGLRGAAVLGSKAGLVVNQRPRAFGFQTSHEKCRHAL